MRELILKMSISIDGFVATPDGGGQWMMASRDEKAAEWSAAAISEASLHIMGSRTFRVMAGYWPTASSVFAPPMNQIPKAVFSKQGASILQEISATAATAAGDAPPAADSWAQAKVASGDLGEEIARLKAGHGKAIIAHGGASFARSLVALGVVDQYVLLVHPVALGQGLPLFIELPAPRAFELVSSTRFPRGTVAQIYRPT
ncbi:dihydrofolate reductase family protein [Dyella telluris]|uniref:Dihydrofolate reductase family protein n=1 Tax=Dyella telluris TaxID=2763498 RepID=A0A7G8Q612_9GAMM|nr:dihydrofolate reductase family protein [Dyella telluris]QNK02220.1 dihydrofolate reductase family protein [Dyella telluris]